MEGGSGGKKEQTKELQEGEALHSELPPSLSLPPSPGLERCAGELVTEMLQLVEEEEDAEEGQMRLVLALFPLLSDLYRQMEEGGKEGGDDGEWAKQCLGHWQEFMVSAFPPPPSLAPSLAPSLPPLRFL